MAFLDEREVEHQETPRNHLRKLRLLAALPIPYDGEKREQKMKCRADERWKNCRTSETKKPAMS